MRGLATVPVVPPDPKTFGLSTELHAYVVAHGTPPDEVLRDLITQTEALGGISVMQIAPEQGAFLTMLARLLGATTAVEIGTFTGYSSTSIARGLAPGGRLICCDVSEEWTAIARQTWVRAGVEDRIELRIAPALDTLATFSPDLRVDLAFVDADKASYAAYVDALHPLMRPGGVIAIDNTIWSGRVIDPSDTSTDTVAIRAFNDRLAADDRFDVVLLPIGDGLTLARTR